MIWNCKDINVKGFFSNSASPYVIYNLSSNVSKNYQTPIIKDNLNPQFNYE